MWDVFPRNLEDFLLFFQLNFSFLLARQRRESLTSGARASGPLTAVPLFSVHTVFQPAHLALNLLLSLWPQCSGRLPWPHSASSPSSVRGNLYHFVCVNTPAFCKQSRWRSGSKDCCITYTGPDPLKYHLSQGYCTGKISLQPPPPPPNHFTEGHSHTAQASPSLALNKQNPLLVSIMNWRWKGELTVISQQRFCFITFSGSEINHIWVFP